MSYFLVLLKNVTFAISGDAWIKAETAPSSGAASMLGVGQRLESDRIPSGPTREGPP